MIPVIRVKGLLLFVLLTSNVHCGGRGGFLFTAPKALISGSDERLCITFLNNTQSVDIRVALLEEKGLEEIASKNEHLDEHESVGKCFNLTIPRTKSKRGRLSLSIAFLTEDYSVNYYEQILIHSSPDVVYILTDKPVYSGGHAVKFRIFIIRSDLTHVDENVERIWIENPNGVHLAQWLNESTSNGFIDKSFQLSNEPIFGLWTIKVKRRFDEETSLAFRVEDYVLPRFTVSLDIPKFANSAEAFNVTVCAKYMFGEPVHGTVYLVLYIKCSLSFYCSSTERTTLQEHIRLNKNGCASQSFTFNNLTTFAQKIMVNATVTEIGTDVQAGAVSGIEIKNPAMGSGMEFSASTKKKRLKAGLPFKGQILQKSPQSPSEVILCFDTGVRTCSRIRLQNGVADFVVPPATINDEKNFTAFLEVINTNRTEENIPHKSKLNLVPWYSPSGSYIQLEVMSEGLLKCNHTATFIVLTSDPDTSTFHYIVKSRGSIIKNGILNSSERTSFNSTGMYVIGTGDFSHVKQFQFSLDITSSFSPISHLLVYYIKNGGEIVADTLVMNVAMCLKTQVHIHWNKNIVLPGDTNKFHLSAPSNSVCALSVTDRSIKILSKSTGFNKESAFKWLKKFDTEPRGQNHNRGTRCRNVTKTVLTDEPSAYLNFPDTDSRFVDSAQAFQDFGALIITNLAIHTRPCKEQWNRERSMRNTSRPFSTRTYGIEPENIIQPKRSDIVKLFSKQREKSTSFELRHFFPETWIWDIIHIGHSGVTELDLMVPHTITEWESEAICLSKENGLGIADVKRITTYQPFFLDFAVPQTVKRKELFYLSASVFNYEKTNLPIKLTYSPSEKFAPKNDIYGFYCVKTKSKIIHEFVLEPLMIGEAIITITAEIEDGFDGTCGNFSRSMRDTVNKKTFVKNEGFPAEVVKSGFICGNDKNFETEVSWGIKIPADIVESSLSINGIVSGDILGPSLKNIDKLLLLPTGCGEQNMILLAPNILILEYLLLTKPNEAELIEKALKNLDLGYQKQLNYRHADGSYSAFGEKDERGSIWLTAFVVRYISQAQKFIHIDKKDLEASVAWILRHQLENGCFPVVGKIYHRDLKGRFSENDSSKALTAYIIISLIESGLMSESDPAMQNAVFCLKGIEQSSGSYGELLTTYALLMVGESRLAQAAMFETLKSANRVYGLLWWESDQDSSTESSIEMTAYGILCLLKLGGAHFTAAASDAVKWITQYRNRNGGFVSTQDTIIALEAISKLSASLPQMDDTDKLTITLETKNENLTFDVTKHDMFIQKRHSLPSYVTDVKFSATGTGCALIQTHARFNTRHGKHNNQLKIQLKIHSISDVDVYFVTKFDICVRLKSAQETIKMAVLEVFMVSGFYPDRTSLYSIPISRKGVRKWEEYEEKIVFYFEDLKQRKVCVQFLVNQEVCVEKTNPAIIKLYDYYNNQHATSVKYNLQPECRNTTGNWLNELPTEKTESKRDTSKDYKQSDEVHADAITDFVDVDIDLERPQEVGPLPLYVPSPLNNTSACNDKKYAITDCPNCILAVPEVLPEIYCSAQRVLAVITRNTGVLEILQDLSPRIDPFVYFERTVSFIMKKECSCPALTKVSSLSLIIVTPLKAQTFNSQYLNFSSSAIIIPIESMDHLHHYLKQAVTYCQQWTRGK